MQSQFFSFGCLGRHKIISQFYHGRRCLLFTDLEVFPLEPPLLAFRLAPFSGDGCHRVFPRSCGISRIAWKGVPSRVFLLFFPVAPSGSFLFFLSGFLFYEVCSLRRLFRIIFSFDFPSFLSPCFPFFGLFHRITMVVLPRMASRTFPDYPVKMKLVISAGAVDGSFL